MRKRAHKAKNTTFDAFTLENYAKWLLQQVREKEVSFETKRYYKWKTDQLKRTKSFDPFKRFIKENFWKHYIFPDGRLVSLIISRLGAWKKPELAYLYFMFAVNAKIAEPDNFIISAMIDVASKNKNFSLVKKASKYAFADSKGKRIDVNALNSLIFAAGTNDDLALARKTFNFLIKNKLADKFSFINMLRAITWSSNVEHDLRSNLKSTRNAIMSVLESARYVKKLDSQMYSLMIAGFAKMLDRVKKKYIERRADGFFRMARDIIFAQACAEKKADLFVYTDMLRVMRIHEKWQEAEKLYSQLLLTGLSPDARVYNIMIQVRVKSKGFEDAKRLFTQVCQKRTANKFTYAIMMGVAGDRGSFKLVDEMFLTVTKEGIAKDLGICNVYLDNLFRQGGTLLRQRREKEAETIFKKAEKIFKESGISPKTVQMNNRTYYDLHDFSYSTVTLFLESKLSELKGEGSINLISGKGSHGGNSGGPLPPVLRAIRDFKRRHRGQERKDLSNPGLTTFKFVAKQFQKKKDFVKSEEKKRLHNPFAVLGGGKRKKRKKRRNRKTPKSSIALLQLVSEVKTKRTHAPSAVLMNKKKKNKSSGNKKTALSRQLVQRLTSESREKKGKGQQHEPQIKMQPAQNLERSFSFCDFFRRCCRGKEEAVIATGRTFHNKPESINNR